MSDKIQDFSKHADYNQTSVAVKHDNVLFIQFKLVGKIPNICCTELTSQNVCRQKREKKPILKKLFSNDDILFQFVETLPIIN